MDARRPASPLRDRPLRVSPAQAMALGIVTVSIGWAVWLLRDRPSSEEVELLAGTSLPSSEMAIMEAAFDRAQLADHRTEGGRVWVPRSRQSAYMRALVDAEALPREFGGSLRRALEKNSPWQSRAVQDELLRVATQEELALVICSMPGIERAAVLYDTEPRQGFDGGHAAPVRTASVNVRTQPDAELDAVRVQAIRVLVSASIAGLAPERVAVTDLRSGRVHAGPLNAEADREAAATAAADPLLARRIAHEHHLAAKLRQALAFVKGAVVDVAMDFTATTAVPPAPEPADPSPATPDQKTADANAPAEILPSTGPTAPAAPAALAGAAPPAGDLPESVIVSIAVPDSYLQAACRAAAERAGQPRLEPLHIEQQEIDRIRRHVLPLVPATRDPAARRIVVTAFPVGGPATGRREAADRSVAPARGQAAGGPSPGAIRQAGTPREVFDALAGGRLDAVPRQAWLAATSVCVGLLAGMLWWLGGRRDPATPAHPPRIDWSISGESDPADGRAESRAETRAGGVQSAGRAAALFVAMLAGGLTAGGIAHAAGPEPVSALAPEPLEIEAGTREHEASARRPASAPPERRAKVPAPLPLDTGRGPAGTVPIASDTTGAAARRTSDWRLLAVIAITFGALAAATAVVRRRAPAPPPPDVFEVLSTASLGGQHSVRIVRFGPKTLLVAVSATGCQTLAELADPQATACIAAACRGASPPIRPQSVTGRSGPSAAPADPRSRPPASPARDGEAA